MAKHRPRHTRLNLHRTHDRSGRDKPAIGTYINPGGQPEGIQLKPCKVYGAKRSIYTRDVDAEVNAAFDAYLAEKGYQKREALITLIRWVYANSIDLGPFLKQRPMGTAKVNIRNVPVFVSDRFQIYCIKAGARQRHVITAIMEWATWGRYDLVMI